MLNQLPPEIIIEILYYLDLQTLGNLALTSRYFYNLIKQENRLWYEKFNGLIYPVRKYLPDVNWFEEFVKFYPCGRVYYSAVDYLGYNICFSHAIRENDELGVDLLVTYGQVPQQLLLDYFNYTVGYGYLGLMHVFYRHGIILNHTNPYYQGKCIVLATMNRRIDVLQDLFAYGAEIVYTFRNPLVDSVHSPDITRLLLAQGCDPFQPISPRDNDYPIIASFVTGDVEFFSTLIRYGIDRYQPGFVLKLIEKSLQQDDNIFYNFLTQYIENLSY